MLTISKNKQVSVSESSCNINFLAHRLLSSDTFELSLPLLQYEIYKNQWNKFQKYQKKKTNEVKFCVGTTV